MMIIPCEEPKDLDVGPRWMRERRQAAWAAFQNPKERLDAESWRFVRMPELAVASLKMPERPSKARLSVEAENWGGHLYFKDNYFLSGGLLSPAAKEAGVRLMPLSQWSSQELAFDAKMDAIGSEPYVQLQAAFCNEGAVLWIPEGVKVQEPIKIHHRLCATGALVAPRLWVLAEPRAQVSVLWVLEGADGSEGLCCSRVDVFAAAGARVDFHSIQALGNQQKSFQWHNHHAQRDAQIHALDIHLGAPYARFENQAYLAGPGSHVQLNSLTLARGHQQFDQRSFQHHNAPHSTSNLLYKNVLWDQARTIFSGMIRVAPLAQHTDAYQANNNLLLSDEAEANALPGLEIQANEVRCSHGATTSQIDPEELFYLRSRGLTPQAAQDLIVQGIVDGMIKESMVAEELKAFIGLRGACAP